MRPRTPPVRDTREGYLDATCAKTNTRFGVRNHAKSLVLPQVFEPLLARGGADEKWRVERTRLDDGKSSSDFLIVASFLREKAGKKNFNVPSTPLDTMASFAASRTPVTGAFHRNAPRRRHIRRIRHISCAYGESQKDGTWVEKSQNAFGKLINVAKGQKEIVQAGTPCLRDIALEVPLSDIDSVKIQELVQEMLTICRGRGVGLAATQIGVPCRIFVMMDNEEGMSDVSPDALRERDRTPFHEKVVINPVVTPMSNLSAAFFEGCLSVQGYRGLVRRYLEVRVTGFGGDGKKVDFVAKGWQARIAQHEMDHLNGVLYVDRMDTRTFRRLDKINEPMPPKHPEFGDAPREGVCAADDKNEKGKTTAGVAGVADVEGFLGKGKKLGKRRKSGRSPFE